jgi:hypothetical protein
MVDDTDEIALLTVFLIEVNTVIAILLIELKIDRITLIFIKLDRIFVNSPLKNDFIDDQCLITR